MPYQFVPYTVLLLASALMTGALAIYGAKQRRLLGTNILGLCMAIGTLWSLANALELSALTFEHKLFWANLQYIAYSLGPVAWLLTSCQFTGRSHWLAWKNVLPLFLIPTITILLVWTDPTWGFVRANLTLNTSGPLYVLDKQYGPWFWVHFSQSYALNFLSILLLTQAALNRKSVYRGQATFLLGGILLVAGSNLLYVLGLGPITDHDITPIVFSLATGLMFWGIYRFDLFQLVPIAWDRVFEAMETGVVVINEAGRVVDLNPAFLHMFSAESVKRSLGIPLRAISRELAEFKPGSSLEVDHHLKIQGSLGEGERDYEVTASTITDHRGFVRGQVMVINDVTELKMAQERLRLEQQEVAVTQERIRFTQDLHDNLGQVLGFSSLQVKAILRELERGKMDKAKESILRLGEVLDEAQRDMRAYVHGMRAREYQQTSLRTLLERQLQRLRDQDHFQRENLILHLIDHDFLPEEKAQICHIVKEALNNILKHSQATRVEIELRPSQETWLLTITDDGIGFDPRRALETETGGSGLSIIPERAGLLGGKMQVTSVPGRTEIRVEFPKRKGAPSYADHDCR